MIKIINFEINNKNNEIIKARFILPLFEKEKLPVVIVLTGDGPNGSNGTSWNNLSTRLAEKGIATLLFDYTGLGFSEGKREELTLSKGIQDFEAVFNSLKNFSWVDFSNIGIFASSFGGSVALHCVEILNKAKVIGLKSPCCFLPDAYVNEISSNEVFLNWIENKYCEENGYKLSVLLDAFNYNIYNDAKNIKTKCLITHGNGDEIVPICQSRYLDLVLECQHDFIVFDNCDHGYSINDSWEKMANIFTSFFVDNLGNK